MIGNVTFIQGKDGGKFTKELAEELEIWQSKGFVPLSITHNTTGVGDPRSVVVIYNTVLIIWKKE